MNVNKKGLRRKGTQLIFVGKDKKGANTRLHVINWLGKQNRWL
jgi:hypothetical protein